MKPIALLLCCSFLVACSMETDGGVERFKQGCKREFAWRGESAVNQCVIKLMIEQGDKFNRDALDRARRG
jgi:hypothetical protein